ncbi:MAG: hypothetical protein ACJA1I_001370 [Zhongshania marina]|jgi:hypothetical protein
MYLPVCNRLDLLGYSHRLCPLKHLQGLGQVRSTKLRCFLIIIIMLQSLSALADMHQYHQADDQHQAVAEHIHQLDLSSLDSSVSDSLDCHHCCHCHGVTASVIPPSDMIAGVYKHANARYSYHPHYSSQISNSLYRPPIA